MELPGNIIEVRNGNIYSKKVTKDINIVSLSDIHICDKTKKDKLDFILNAVNNEHPDYICILGDVIDSPEIIDNIDNRIKVFTFLKELAKITKVFVVVGNHDYIHYYKYMKHQEDFNKKYFDEINNIDNVYMLIDDTYTDDDVFIMGYFDKYNIYHSRDMNKFGKDIENKTNLYKDIPKDKYDIMLMHSPEPLKVVSNRKYVSDYDLILGGHYHNGCLPAFLEHIWLPKDGGIVTPSKDIFPRNCRGLEKINDNSYLFYNGGIVKMANNTPKYMHFLDYICYRQMDSLKITNKEQDKNFDISYKLVRK